MSIKRHLVIPDTQVKPGVPTVHFDWIGWAVRKYKPDVVIHLGDHWDFPSLSSYAKPQELEGARIAADIQAGNAAMERLNAAMGKFKGRKILLRGNHEDRLRRYLKDHPSLGGILGFHLLADRKLGWEVVDYVGDSPGQIVIDGVRYAHYFAHPSTGNPCGGQVPARMAKIAQSFVQGHVQGLMRGDVPLATGRTLRGIVAGSAYLHDEDYRGVCNQEDRCILVLNGVHDGRFTEMVLDFDYLCREVTGQPLDVYLRKTYRNAEQRFTCARKIAA